MKNIYTLFISFLIISGISACKKESLKVVSDKSSKALAISANPTDTIGHSLIFYGTSTFGGNLNPNDNPLGIIYKINGDGSGYEVVYKFDKTTGIGYWPAGTMIEAPNGKLYGETTFGGSNNGGTIFSFDPITKAVKKVFDFDKLHAFVNESLMLASNGKIYGGFGLDIFSVDPATDAYSTVYTIVKPTNTSISGNSALLQGHDGKLYGIAATTGNGSNEIFSYNISQNLFKIVYYFPYRCNGVGAPGTGVFASGVKCIGTDGSIYGVGQTVTPGSFSHNGEDDSTLVYKYSPVTGLYTQLYAIQNIVSVNDFNNAIVQGPGNKLYGTGTTTRGGAVYSYNSVAKTFTIEHEFTGFNNTYDPAIVGVIKASNGLMYGKTVSSGPNTSNTGVWTLPGIIYRFNPANPQSYTIIHYITDGSESFGDLTEYHHI